MPYYTMPDRENLFVRRVGRGEPVLVLSGLGMQSWQWLPFIYANRKDYEFIIPDWRGFGGSKNCAIPEQDAISSHWQDVAHLIEQLKLDNFILMGYSMGATTAMHGMKHAHLAQQLKAYLHIDQTPKISVDSTWEYGLFGSHHTQFKQLLNDIYQLLSKHKNAKYLYELSLPDRQELVRLWVDFIDLQSSNPFSPLVFKTALKQPFLQKYLLPIQRLDYLFWYVENYLYHNEDYREAIQQLECPTTFFIGRNSTLYPETGQTLIAQSVEHAKAIYFERSGHTPLLTEPKKFGHEITTFLSELQHAS